MVELSTKPYLIRAIYEWCADCGYTPYLSVRVDENTRVPMEYVKDGEIVLNVGHGASRNLTISNDIIQFSARFNGVSREIAVPTYAVQGIFARETGKGAFFEVEEVPAQFSMGDKSLSADGDGKPAPRGLRLASVSPLSGADDDAHPSEEAAPMASIGTSGTSSAGGTSSVSSIRTMRSVPTSVTTATAPADTLAATTESAETGRQSSPETLKFPPDAGAKKNADKPPSPPTERKASSVIKAAKAPKLSVSPAPPSDEPPPTQPTPPAAPTGGDQGGKKSGLRVIK